MVAEFGIAVDVEIDVTAATTALGVLAWRYPEISVVGRYRSLATGSEVWICRAPNVVHIERWIDESCLHVTCLRRLTEV